MHVEHQAGRSLADTEALADTTGRSRWVVRANCPREPGGYDVEASMALLKGVPEPVLLTAVDAERYLGIRAATVRQWAHRRLITSYDRDGRGSPLYDALDLARRAKLDR